MTKTVASYIRSPFEWEEIQQMFIGFTKQIDEGRFLWVLWKTPGIPTNFLSGKHFHY